MVDSVKAEAEVGPLRLMDCATLLLPLLLLLLLLLVVAGATFNPAPVGFLSIDNNSAEDTFTLDVMDDFEPVAAEAKLPASANEIRL